MRTHLPKLMLLGLGGGIAAYMFSRKRFDVRAATADPMAPDSADPVQSFDELNPLRLDELDVDAMSMVDSEVNIDTASREVAMDNAAMELDDVQSTVGDLFEVESPRAAAMVDGQNWIEALETSAAENGPAPEEPIANLDEDTYGATVALDFDDPPVADRGSGGPAGI